MGSTALVLLPALGYVLLHLVGWAAPLYLWGVDQFHYYPSWSLGLLLLALLPVGLGLWKRQGLEGADRSLIAALDRVPPGRGTLYKAVFLAVFFFACWLWRVEAHVLGDSAMWLKNLEILRVPGQEEIITWIIGLPWEGYGHLPALQALDFAIHLQAYRWGHTLFGWKPADAYAWISIASGLGYAAVLWRLAALLGQERYERLTLLVFLLSLGNLQFFFGYGESYTLIALTMALYALWALRYLRGQASLWAPTACLGATLALHLMPLALAPSWLYLLWRHPGRLGAWVRRPRVYGLLALVGGGAALALYAGFYSKHHLPLWTPEEEGRFAVFSLPHLANLSSQILLLSPFGIVWGVAAALRRQPATGESRFLGWAALGCWGLIAVHNITMGGRDWDLMAMPCLFYALWGLVHLLQRDRGARLLCVRWGVLPVALLHNALWIGINADEGRTKERLENLLRFGPNQPTHYQEFTRGYQYSNIKKDEYAQAITHYSRALESYGGSDDKVRARYRKYLGMSLARQGRHAAADSVFCIVYGQDNRKAEVLDNNDLIFWSDWLGALYALAREAGPGTEALWERTAELGRDILTYEKDADVALLQGVALFRTGALEEAANALQLSLTLEDDAAQRYEVMVNLGRVLVAAGRPQDAVELLRRAAEEFPHEFGVHFLLGEVLQTAGNSAGTIPVYRRALELQPGHTGVRRSLALALLEQGQASEAAVHWRRLLETGGDEVEARNNLGWSLYLQGEHAAAIVQYRRVLDTEANSVAHFNLGLAQLAGGDTAAAARTYEEAVVRHGNEAAARAGAAVDLQALMAGAADAVRAAAARILPRLQP